MRLYQDKPHRGRSEVNAQKLRFQSIDLYLMVGQQCETAVKMKGARCAVPRALKPHLQEQVLNSKPISVLQRFSKVKRSCGIIILTSL